MFYCICYKLIPLNGSIGTHGSILQRLLHDILLATVVRSVLVITFTAATATVITLIVVVNDKVVVTAVGVQEVYTDAVGPDTARQGGRL